MTCRVLHCHSITPEPAVHAMHVRIERSAPERVGLRYRLEGAVEALQLPEPAPSVHTDELWRGTCFEAFLRGAGAAAYLEANASPSGAWALYAFDGYRHGMQNLTPATAPGIACRVGAGHLQFDLEIDLTGLAIAGAELELAVAAVLKRRAGTMSYWALTHPGKKPDFHHPDSFTERLSP